MQHSSFVSPVFGQPSVRTLRNAEDAAQASVIPDKSKGWPPFSSLSRQCVPGAGCSIVISQ